MKLLLDTHALIWYLEGSLLLPETARVMIDNAENEVFISAVSLWELSIKISLGKLKRPLNLSTLELAKHLEVLGFLILPISPTHLDVLSVLPFHHKDPFDRLLIAQAIAENIPVLSRNAVFQDYPVTTLEWDGVLTDPGSSTEQLENRQ
jgi:PIN domain nuclease of toxin-antitoxin system